VFSVAQQRSRIILEKARGTFTLWGFTTRKKQNTGDHSQMSDQVIKKYPKKKFENAGDPKKAVSEKKEPMSELKKRALAREKRRERLSFKSKSGFREMEPVKIQTRETRERRRKRYT